MGTKSKRKDAVKAFESGFRNTVLTWQGQVLRVDGDNIEQSDLGDELDIAGKSELSHNTLIYPGFSSAEILVRMNPPLRGIFSS